MDMTKQLIEKNKKAERDKLLLTVIIDNFVSDRAGKSNEYLMNSLYDDNLTGDSIFIMDVYADWHLPFLYETIKDLYMSIRDIQGEL